MHKTGFVFLFVVREDIPGWTCLFVIPEFVEFLEDASCKLACAKTDQTRIPFPAQQKGPVRQIGTSNDQPQGFVPFEDIALGVKAVAVVRACAVDAQFYVGEAQKLVQGCRLGE